MVMSYSSCQHINGTQSWLPAPTLSLVFYLCISFMYCPSSFCVSSLTPNDTTTTLIPIHFTARRGRRPSGCNPRHSQPLHDHNVVTLVDAFTTLNHRRISCVNEGSHVAVMTWPLLLTTKNTTISELEGYLGHFLDAILPKV